MYNLGTAVMVFLVLNLIMLFMLCFELNEFSIWWGLSLNRLIYLDSCYFLVVQDCIEMNI